MPRHHGDVHDCLLQECQFQRAHRVGEHGVIQLQTGHVIVALDRDTLAGVAARQRVSLDGNGLNKRRCMADCRLPRGAVGARRENSVKGNPAVQLVQTVVLKAAQSGLFYMSLTWMV